jgi:hypothetical protein
MSAAANINEVISHSSMRLISFTDIKDIAVNEEMVGSSSVPH